MNYLTSVLLLTTIILLTIKSLFKLVQIIFDASFITKKHQTRIYLIKEALLFSPIKI